MTKYPTPTGQLSARIYGAQMEMRERAASARAEAGGFRRSAPEFAAAMRGKARGYEEAADMLAALDQGRRIPKRRRWTGWVPAGRPSRGSVDPSYTDVISGPIGTIQSEVGA